MFELKHVAAKATSTYVVSQGIIISFILFTLHHHTNAQPQRVNEDSWYIGCYQQSNISQSLLESSESSSGSHVASVYHTDYGVSLPPPVYGSTLCLDPRLPYVAVVNGSGLYCIKSPTDLQLTLQRNDTVCNERCSTLPCGSTSSQYLSIYNGANYPSIRDVIFEESVGQLFTLRNLQFEATITFTKPYGPGLIKPSVQCVFTVDGEVLSRSRTVDGDEEVNSVQGSCSFDHTFTEEGTYIIESPMGNGWCSCCGATADSYGTSANTSTAVTVVHEVPERPSVEVYLSNYELPTCISNQHELDGMEHRQTVKVFVDTPTPFKAHIGQGINVTFDWIFDNETRYSFRSDPATCTSTCSQSLITHTFTSLGVHDISVNFSNAYGQVSAVLSVIAVSKGIHNVSVEGSHTSLLVREHTPLQFSIVTSTRYYTYVEIDQGDGVIRRLSVVDPLIANMDQLLGPSQLEGYEKVTSSYGVGCTLSFITSRVFFTKEGHFNLTWSVFNNHTTINSTSPIMYSVYKPIVGLRLIGHVSYQVGMLAHITASLDIVSSEHTITWTLEDNTGSIVYEVTGFRKDVFTYHMNETGVFSLICEVLNPQGAHASKQVMLTVLDRLGNLTAEGADNSSTQLISTHQTLSFAVHLDSGKGAEYVWDVVAANKSISHVVPENLGLVGKVLITFIKPDVYTVTAMARIGGESTPVQYVGTVEVYEKITHVTCLANNSNQCIITAFVNTGSNVNMTFHYPTETLTRYVSANGQTTVSPPHCPSELGAYEVTVDAVNAISSLQLNCPIVIEPEVSTIVVDITAAYHIQLEATLDTDLGVVPAVYIWCYLEGGGRKQVITSLPFVTLDELRPQSEVTSELFVLGLRGGRRTIHFVRYQHMRPYLRHPSVVTPGQQFNIVVENVDGYTNGTLKAFTTECSFNFGVIPQPTCTATAANSPTVSTLSLTLTANDGSNISLHSTIAAVPALPDSLSISCPLAVIADRRSHVLITADLGEGKFYEHYTWYKNSQNLYYTALPNKLYTFDSEGEYNVTVVASNAWGSVCASCLITASLPLIELQVKPSVVHRLVEFRLLTQEPTAITLQVYGSTAITNLTVDFGDGEITTYSTRAISRLDWTSVGSGWHETTLSHYYISDRQYKVHVVLSTEQTTLNATGIVYRSVNRVYHYLLNGNRGDNFQVEDSVILKTEVGRGDYLSFKWSYQGPVEVIETTSNYSKARVKIVALGKPSIICRVYHPAYPEGLEVSYRNTFLVVIEPEQLLIEAFVGGKKTTSAQLTAESLNVTFLLRYTEGPENAMVELYADFGNEPRSGYTNSSCVEQFGLPLVCTASLSYNYTKPGSYNVTMLVMVGEKPAYKSMVFQVLPPSKMLKFVHANKTINSIPTYYFHLEDTARFTVQLQMDEPLEGLVTYHWSFGDQTELDIISNSSSCSVTNKYMYMMEAGFDVTVIATTEQGVELRAVANAIIYTPIQSVELSVNGRTWTTENQGKLHFLPEELEEDLLLIIKVYPEGVPFERCHLVKPPHKVRDSFLPENSGHEMHAYYNDFNPKPWMSTSLRKLRMAAHCVNVRPPGVPVSIIRSEILTVYRVEYINDLDYMPAWIAGEKPPDIKVGANLTYYCRGMTDPESSYYKHFLNGQLTLEGRGESAISFVPHSEQVYNLTCCVNNGVNEKCTSFYLPVLNFTCNVNINIGSKITHVVDSNHQLSQWYRSEAVPLQGIIEGWKCSEATLWTTNWTLTRDQGGQEENVPIEGYSTASDLYLPPRTLQPGIYTAHYMLSIPGTHFIQRASEQVIIKETPFRAIISGGIGKKIDFRIPQLIHLDGSESFDPDDPDSDDLGFVWACHLLHRVNTSCFKNNSVIQFAVGKKATVNTSELMPLIPEVHRGYQIVLVVFRDNRSVVGHQIWDPVSLGHPTLQSSVDATCETCTDDPDMQSSVARPVVFKTACKSADSKSCDNMRYSWNVKIVPAFSKEVLVEKNTCLLRGTHIYVSTTASPVPGEMTTMPTTSAYTTPDGSGGNPLFYGLEEGNSDNSRDPLPQEAGSGGDRFGYTMSQSSTTEMYMPGYLDFSDGDSYADNNPRQPITTTLSPTVAPRSFVILPGCGCAIDEDLIVTNYNSTLYEKDRIRVENHFVTGRYSSQLIIEADTLRSRASYIVELNVSAPSSTGHESRSVSYYLLTTGPSPAKRTCYPSYSKRGKDNKVIAWYDFAEVDGTELDKGYEFGCTIPKKNGQDLYAYVYEVYIQRVPGELEIVYRSYSERLHALQVLPAGFPQYNYTVKLEVHIVDMFGNRFVTCPEDSGHPLNHRVLPHHFDGSASDVVYELVRNGQEVDWYDEDRMWANMFTVRNNMLAVSEVLNRVHKLEKSEDQVGKRNATRSLLLLQLMDTPHRFTAEVEQKLGVLRSIVKVKAELDPNSTVRAADLLVHLVDNFTAFAPTDRPRDVNFTTHVVIDISSKLMRCLSQDSQALYGHTAKLDNAINTIILASIKADLLPAPGEITRQMHGMTIVTRRSTEVEDEIIGHGDVSFHLPRDVLKSRNDDSGKLCHTTSMIQYASNPFKAGIDSVVTALSLFDCDGDEIKVDKIASQSAHITIKLPLTSDHTQEVMSNFTIKKEEMNFHVIDIDASNAGGKSLSVVFRFTQYDGHTFPITVMIRKNEPPSPKNEGYDRMMHVDTKRGELQLFFSSEDIGSARKLYVGIADANFNEGKPRDKEIKERHYSVSSWWSECVYWDTVSQNWSGRGCSVTRETTLTVSHCSCSHLTAFASKREVIVMKLLQHSVDKYFELRQYPTTKVMVSLALVFYAALAIICYVADHKSPVQERVIAIQDNRPSDRQRYIITIETGSEPGSGTSAKVSLVLHGEEGMSETRELIGPEDGRVFVTNSRDTFLLTLPSSLGPIWKVQLWHNNKGSSPGWYIKRVTVRDIESAQSYYFLCESWLAVEESDGKVEREFMALDAHIGFKVVFKVKAPQYFNDYHLIRSLIYKPTFSHFSRLERLTCVFVGFLAHMALCTGYYYHYVQEYRGQYNLFDLSTETVVVALLVNCCACPLMLLLSMVFRRSSIGGRPIFPPREEKKPRLSGKGSDLAESAGGHSTHPPVGSHSVLEQSIQHWQSLQEWAQKQWEKRYQKAQLAGEELNAVEAQMQEQVLTLASTQSAGGMFANRVNQSKVGSQSDVKQLITPTESDRSSTSSQESSVRAFIKSRRWYLPPWFRIVAWLLSLGCAVCCVYITIVYSDKFQEGRFVLWLQSIFVTFLFCNFVIQPVGILGKAIVTALVYRRDPTVLQHFPDRYEEDIKEIRIRYNSMSDEDEMTRGTRARQRSRYLRFARPPQERQLIAARKRTMKEKKLIRLGVECGVLALTLTLLIIIVFCCERSKAFYLNSKIKDLIATNEITAQHQPFLNISRPKHMWNWLENDLRQLLFTEHAHNLGSSLILGNATRLKQVRVQEEECVAKDRMPTWSMRKLCHPPYSRYTVDQEPHRMNNRTIEFTEVTGTEDAVLYGQLTSYTESGYELLLPVTEESFMKELERLKTSRWIDKNTRAVFVELTVYNLPTHLYSSVTALFEFSATGQVLPMVDVDSAKLYRYRSTNGYVVLTAELIFIFVYLCQLHFTIMSVVRLQKKFFTQIWNILDCMYMILSLAYIILYLYRFEIVEMLHNELTQTFHSAFVSMAPLVFWDRVLKLLLGLLVFITVLKILKLFRYIKTFARLGNVYRRAARDIRGFAVFFLLLVITYTNLGVALFQPVAFSFSDYWHALVSVTGCLTGSGVSYREFEHSMPFWGGAYMILLSGAGHGLLMAVMVAILSYHFRDFKQDTILAMDLKEAARFAVKKVFKRFNKKRQKEVEDNDSQDLSPEYALAEMEYQVNELLFKMSALCDGVSLPSKPSMYYATDSDMTLADEGHKMEDENSLTRLLQLQSIGTGIGEGEQSYNRSQLEMDVLRQLQLSHHRDAGINVWNDLRGVSVEQPFSDPLPPENDIPIHRYNGPNHTYKGDGSDDDDSYGSFLSIPDESHAPFANYTSRSPSLNLGKTKSKKQKSKCDNKQCAKAEVYELNEHPRSLTPEIAYHNDAYVSDVEVEVDLEYTPPPYRANGNMKRSQSMTKSQGAYHNQAYDGEEDGCQQTEL